MSGCAIIDVTETKGALSYGESIEKGVFGTDQGSVPACRPEGQDTDSGGVLRGLRTPPQACDTAPESRCAPEEEEARPTQPVWPRGYPLENIWLNADRPCSVRLLGMIPLWLPWYEKRHGDLDAKSRGKLLAIRPLSLIHI